MLDAFSLVMVLGLVSLPLTLIGVFVSLRGWHIAFAFATGLALLPVGYSFGVDRFCVAGAGNLCGLAGAFGTGPLGFFVGSLGYALVFRLLGARKAVESGSSGGRNSN